MFFVFKKMVHHSKRCKAKTLSNKRCSKRKQKNSDYCCIHAPKRDDKLIKLFYTPLFQAFKILKARTGLGSPLLTKLYQQLNYSNFPEFLDDFKNSDKLNLFYLKDKLWHKMDQEYVNKCAHTLLNKQVEFNHQDYKYNLQQLVKLIKEQVFVVLY